MTSIYPGALGKNINQAINTSITAKGVAFNSLNALNEQEFFKQLELMFNVDEAGFKDFAFMIFDTNNDEKISELDLQELMKSSTTEKFYHAAAATEPKRNETIIELNEKGRDIFLDYFYPDYIKIIQKIKQKKKAKGKTDDDIRQTQFALPTPNNKEHSTKIPHLGRAKATGTSKTRN